MKFGRKIKACIQKAGSGFQFSDTVQTDIYTEWRGYYLDYTKLKKYLKGGTWTQDREDGFVQILEGELEKIQSFQASKVRIRRHSGAEPALMPQILGGRRLS
jgi:hypothetical protein